MIDGADDLRKKGSLDDVLIVGRHRACLHGRSFSKSLRYSAGEASENGPLHILPKGRKKLRCAGRGRSQGFQEFRGERENVAIEQILDIGIARENLLDRKSTRLDS